VHEALVTELSRVLRASPSPVQRGNFFTVFHRL